MYSHVFKVCYFFKKIHKILIKKMIFDDFLYPQSGCSGDRLEEDYMFRIIADDANMLRSLLSECGVAVSLF
jgi:hypothetical protein